MDYIVGLSNPISIPVVKVVKNNISCLTLTR